MHVILITTISCITIMYKPLEDWACFSKFFPFPTLASLLHIFWPPFTFSTQIWFLFEYWVLLLPTCLPGLKSPQAIRRTNWNAVLSLFWLQLGQTKQPYCMLTLATPTISEFTAMEMSQLPPINSNIKLLSVLQWRRPPVTCTYAIGLALQ